MRDLRWETRLLTLVAAILVVFGLTAVYGASSLLTISGGQVGSSFALKQALGAAVGGIVAALLARSDYRKWQRWAWPVLGLAAVLLLIPLLPFTHRIAPTINGARRWVNLGFVTVQPSELAKFAVVVWTAMLAAKKGERIRTFQYGLLPFIVVLTPLLVLIFFEPNLSMAVLVALLAGVVLFTAGARIGHFLALAVVATPLLFGAVASAQYRLARVITFLNPGSAPSEATWQVHQSLVGIGAGRLFGVGLGQGQQKLGYLPYAYSDFIFSTIGEEWGFLGVLALLVLFGTFVWLRCEPRPAAGHRDHAAVHLLRTVEPVRRPRRDRRVDQHWARKTECGGLRVRSAECGVRNGHATFVLRIDLPFTLRTPHSAFRTWVGW